MYHHKMTCPPTDDAEFLEWFYTTDFSHPRFEPTVSETATPKDLQDRIDDMGSRIKKHEDDMGPQLQALIDKHQLFWKTVKTSESSQKSKTILNKEKVFPDILAELCDLLHELKEEWTKDLAENMPMTREKTDKMLNIAGGRLTVIHMTVSHLERYLEHPGDLEEGEI